MKYRLGLAVSTMLAANASAENLASATCKASLTNDNEF